MSYRKYLLILGVIGSFFAIVPVAFAAGSSFVSITQFPAFNTSASGELGPFINSLYNYLIGIAAILAVLEITWGGFLWMGSGASVTSKEAGRNKIMMALTGLLLVLSPVIIFSIINPSVLSLKLGTNSINITQPHPGDSQPTVVAPFVGCVPAGGGPLLKKYTCAGSTQVSDTEQYCTAPLSQPTLTCTATDSEGCTKQTLYCSAPTSTQNANAAAVQGYEFVFNTSPLKVSGVTIFPKSIASHDSFKNSCVSSGGNVDGVLPKYLVKINSWSKNGGLFKDSLKTLYGAHRVFPCTSDYVTKDITVPSNTYLTLCFPVTLACTPPTK